MAKPGYNNYRKRKRRYRKRPWYKKKYTVGEMAGKALSGVNQLRKLVNVEHKKADFSGSSNIGNSWTNVFHYTSIPQGDTASTRSGNSFLAKSLSGMYRMSFNASATATTFRIVILMDNQTVADGGTVSGTDVFATAADITLLNINALGRYTILHDELVTLYPDKPLHVGKVSIPLNKHIRYNGILGSDINSNGIYMLAISNEATNTPNIYQHLRLTFVDN